MWIPSAALPFLLGNVDSARTSAPLHYLVTIPI